MFSCLYCLFSQLRQLVQLRRAKQFHIFLITTVHSEILEEKSTATSDLLKISWYYRQLGIYGIEVSHNKESIWNEYIRKEVIIAVLQLVVMKEMSHKHK